MLYMMHQHFLLSLVTVKNKLFVMDDGRNNCEVFDDVGKKFVALSSSCNLSFNKAMYIGNKFMVFQYKRSSVVFYDVNKNKWSEELRVATKDIVGFSCFKMPQY